MRPPPRIGLVVLNWNSWRDTRECLDSIANVLYGALEIFVVDNGSWDDSPDRIAATFPMAKLLRLPLNRGYGGGMNEGIRAALGSGCEFVLCLNNDMTLDPASLEPLVNAAREEFTVPFPTIYQRENPEFIDSAGNHLSYTGLTTLIAHGARGVSESLEADYTELPFLSRELVELIGGFQEDYFTFYEDVDLCLRIRAAGWHFRLVLASKVYHRRGSTTRRIPGLVSYYSVRNRFLLMRDNGTRGRWILSALHVLFLTLPFQLLESLANPASKHSARHLLSGLIDGLLPWRRRVVREWPPPA